MRFKGQFSQPVGQGGSRVPGTSPAAPIPMRWSTPARSSVGGSMCFATAYLCKPSDPGIPQRPTDCVPCPHEPKSGTRPTALDIAIEIPHHTPQTRCSNPGQQAADRLPMSDVVHRPCNRDEPGSCAPRRAARPMPTQPAAIQTHRRKGPYSLPVRGDNDRMLRR